MPNTFSSSTFSNTYNDDWTESDGYHRILFNSGRYLQARELTQLQTIQHQAMARFGRNIFKEGAAVNPGGLTVDNKYEFIKLGTGLSLPSNPDSLVGTIYTGQTSGVKAEVIQVVPATGSDPDTLYVRYTDTSLGVSGSTSIRMSAGEDITNGSHALVVQSTNTTVNPAVGAGTKVSIASGDFFVQGYFVFAPAQTLIVSKYTSDPTLEVGFKVVQDVITVSDTAALYDNSGPSLNISSPGADRYRIRLIATTRDDVDSDENFVYISKIQDGRVVDVVEATDDYNRINDLLALRTKEESGNYTAKDFTIKFDPNDSDTTSLIADISDGIAYINGYRAENPYPIKLNAAKAQDTATKNNEVVSANYGNYIRTNGCIGLRNINEFELVNLRDSSDYLGSTIGTARVRSLQPDDLSGNCLRHHLFDIQMNSGESFRNVKSIGNGVSDYSNVVLEAGKAVLYNTGENTLLFPLPNGRPQSLSDISLTVQRRFSTTTDGSGNATLTLTASGETFANTTSWAMANADSAVHSGATITGSGTASASISNGPISSSNLEVIGYVNKGAGASRTKTLTNTTVTGTIDSDGNGVKYIDLGRADIYNVTRIRAIDSDGADISAKFTVDNGQRDNFYALGRLVLKGGQSAPSGNVFARFNYFAHGTSGDFFSVNSYTGQVDYEDIPSYRQNDGTVIPLRDVLDFRPVQNASSTYSGGNARINELPAPTDLITTDVVYYLPRYSRLVINTDGDLEFINGASSLTPIYPPVPENSLNLFDLQFNAYTLNDSDVNVIRIENPVYTMGDIARLESRIDDLEELTTLSLLELDTKNFEVLDSAGLNRFKSGFLVDNFRDHFSSDITSGEYRSAIDFVENNLKPNFTEEIVDLQYDSDLSSNVVRKSDTVFLKYSHLPMISQTLATGTENINPFAVILNNGNITLSPRTDTWRDIRTTRLTNWTNTMLQGQSRTEIRVDDVSVIPFMRSVKVFFRARGMRPNTRVFPFFDGVNVSQWCREETFVNRSSNPITYGNSQRNATSHPEGSSTLTTDDEGKVEGSFFIPNTSAQRFRTGTKEFKLLDISADNEEDALSIGRSAFMSNGTLIRRTQTTTSGTRRDQTPAQRRREREEQRASGWDPLAQSFKVNGADGAFVTKVDVYFATKDDTVPVQLEIRPMENGHPSSTAAMAGSVVFLSPSSVNTSSDASVATTFEFDAPVYLDPETEYAIVLLADTTAYNVYVAETYQFLLGSTERKVTKQPTMGSLFKSQNGSTWTPDQTKDLTFNIYQAQFDTAGGYAVLENVDLPVAVLDQDPITVDSGDATVTFSHPNSGLFVGDTVTISGIDSSADIGGISGSSILGDRTITAVDYTGYTFEADSAATSSTITGGGSVTVTKGVLFDQVIPNIDTIVPRSSTASYTGKFTTGMSYAGSETAYQKDVSYSDLYNQETNVFSAPRLVANSTNEAAELGAGVRSATIRVDLTTPTANVSPFIDLNTSSLLVNGNVIDKQNSTPATGYNVPLNFVAETDPAFGSHASKHLTKAVILEEDAVGIKILMAVNRPSVADVKVYYRTGTDDTVLTDIDWTEVSIERSMPTDENTSVFRQYEYIVGGKGGTLTPFTQFQIKVVMQSTNSSKVPSIRDLRVIALGV